MILRVDNVYNPISNSTNPSYGTNTINPFFPQNSKPQKNSAENPDNKNGNTNSVSQTDKGNNTSGNKSNNNASEAIKQSQIREEVSKLQAIENRVISHEAAHKAVGGNLAGAASYQYSTGPDGKTYITGGEVSINISEGKTPEETINRMQQVRAAALAPSDPSPQDYKVAALASQTEMTARLDLLSRNSENHLNSNNDKTKDPNNENSSDSSSKSQAISQYNKIQNYSAIYSPKNLIGIG